MTVTMHTICGYAASVADAAEPDPEHHPDGLHRCTQLVPVGGDHLGTHTCACGAAFVVTASIRPAGSTEWAVNPATTVTATTGVPGSTGVVYLLWSQSHTAWWGRRALGYTDSLDDAGRFTEAEAVRHVIASAASGIRTKVTFMVAAPDNWSRS